MDTHDEAVDAQLRKMSRRGFAKAAAVVLAGYGSWRWLVGRSEEDGLIWPLRRVLQLNERLGMATFRPSRLDPEYDRARARTPRANGELGMPGRSGEAAPGPGPWLLKLGAEGIAGETQTLTLDEIRSFKRAEQTTELKCIEGWSTVVHWAGVRLADVAAATGLSSRSGRKYDPDAPPDDLLTYAGLATGDGGYYVGLDMPSALHPQTLLCFEMNGGPLRPEHGAPLRLVIPVKYGIKNIKWVDRIWFSDRRPADYWAEQGYDWFAGH